MWRGRPRPRSHGIICPVKSGSTTDLYRKLPSVDELLRTPAIADLISREGPAAVTESARAVLSRLREEIGTALVDDESLDLALSGIPSAIERELQQALGYSLRTVINATGVILHTNLGRAPLSHAAIDHIREIAGAYSNLANMIYSCMRERRSTEIRVQDHSGRVDYGAKGIAQGLLELTLDRACYPRERQVEALVIDQCCSDLFPEP